MTGPMTFPTQYPTKVVALTVDFSRLELFHSFERFKNLALTGMSRYV